MTDRNPYSPPQTPVGDIAPVGETDADIDALPVSDKWKRKFRLMRRAGGPSMRNAKALSFGERQTMMFNVLAFLFGPFYYATKGMWRKGLTLFVACATVVFLVGLVLEAMGYERLVRALGYGAAGLFAMRANVDYYKKMVLKQNGWW